MGIFEFLGGLVGQHGANQAVTATNNQNMWLAQENRSWQESMSNSAHTREVADLRNAGLNPILSATGGQGASTPSPALPTMEPVPQKFNPLAAMASALEVKKLAADVKKVGAETELTDQMKSTSASQALLNSTNSAKAVQELGPLRFLNDLSVEARTGMGKIMQTFKPGVAKPIPLRSSPPIRSKP